MKIVLENLTKKFPNRNKKGDDVIAVNDFSFEIPDGKLIGLLGPSGCGKSTCLNLISGLETPTSGKIFFDDEDVTDVPPENRGVGLVFQNYALYPHLTVKKNIMFPLENFKGDKKLDKRQMEEKALEAAKLVQIEALLDRKPSELSGGQQQRVAIARALVKMPRVLLLDEPLSNLDARLRLQTREEIRRIQRETGITTVFVTHDQEEAMSISDMIVVMKDGVIQQIDKPQAMYDDPKNLFTAKFLGTPAINVFSGSIMHGQVCVGEDPIMPIKHVENRKVYAAIRPEGFVPRERGKLKCELVGVEVMGRDTSIISRHSAFLGESNIRSIVSSDRLPDLTGKEVRFNVKPNKLFIFDCETEERIYFDTDTFRLPKEPPEDEDPDDTEADIEEEEDMTNEEE